MATLTIVVRPIEIGDLESVADLMIEMDEFYDEPDRESAETKIANMREFVFRDPPSAHLLVAYEENTSAILGIAAYSYLWPAVGTTRSLYLKELNVRKVSQHGGIGRLLMESLFGLGRGSGCSRIEWTTDRTNATAQRFYHSLDAMPEAGKLFYRRTLC